jgi:hypothetical protein
MKLNKHCSLISGLLSLGMIFLVGRVPAGPLVFTVDNTQSQISLSGKIAGTSMNPQGAGSLTTTYSGNINADVAGSTIQFTGSSAIIAKTNGVWQPAVGGGSGFAPADYGGQINIQFIGPGYGAARNIVLDLNSSVLTLTSTNFDSTALIFSFATNSTSSFDYNAGVLGQGTLSMTGNSTNSVANGASLSTNGNVIKLVIQIDAQFVFKLLSAGDTPLNLTGQIVATNVVPPPIISSIVVNNQNAVLTVQNAMAGSHLQISTNLLTWLPASTTVSNYLGLTIYTTPLASSKSFFRVLQ